MQQIDHNRKAEKEYNADKVDHCFHVTVDRLLAYPLDKAKNNFTAVQRRYRQEVKHRQIHTDKRRNV